MNTEMLLGLFYGFLVGVILGKLAIIGYYVVMKVILDK